MNTTYEGYAKLLEQFELAQEVMDSMKAQLSFVWMNTKQGNFRETDAHAWKEFRYLENGIRRLELQMAEMMVVAHEFRTSFQVEAEKGADHDQQTNG